MRNSTCQKILKFHALLYFFVATYNVFFLVIAKSCAHNYKSPITGKSFIILRSQGAQNHNTILEAKL